MLAALTDGHREAAVDRADPQPLHRLGHADEPRAVIRLRRTSTAGADVLTRPRPTSPRCCSPWRRLRRAHWFVRQITWLTGAGPALAINYRLAPATCSPPRRGCADVLPLAAGSRVDPRTIVAWATRPRRLTVALLVAARTRASPPAAGVCLSPDRSDRKRANMESNAPTTTFPPARSRTYDGLRDPATCVRWKRRPPACRRCRGSPAATRVRLDHRVRGQGLRRQRGRLTSNRTCSTTG
jgi:hypothetical protein